MNTAALKMSQEFQETAGFGQKQAEVLAEAIYKSREDLATKQELETGLKLLRLELSAEIAKVQSTTIYAALAVILVVLAVNADLSDWFESGASTAAPASIQEVEANAGVSSASLETGDATQVSTLEVPVTSRGAPDGVELPDTREGVGADPAP